MKTHFPCKHFFAVFNAYEEWDFPRLPCTYLNNVFITLDNTGFEERGEDFRQQFEDEVDSMDIDEAETEDDSTSQDHDVPSTDSPCDYKNISDGFSSERSDCKSNRETNRNINSDPSVAKLRTQVRETAGLVRNATYHVTNIACLKEAMEALKKIHRSLMCNSLREGGLPIRSSPAKKRLKVTSLDYHKVFHKKLPLRRKRKIRVKSKKNPKAENIPVVDLTCTSPLPPEDQVGIYAGTHVDYTPGSLQSTKFPLNFFSRCPLLSQIVIEEGIDLEVLPPSEEEQGFGEDCSQTSVDHSSCPKTTVGPDENTVDR